MLNFNKSNWRWQLNDGKIWSTLTNDFTTHEEALSWAKENVLESIPLSPVDTKGEHSLEGLIQALEFYQLSKGSLKSTVELIQEIQLKYKPKLDELIATANAAQMMGDLEDVEEIKKDYQDLLSLQILEIKNAQGIK